MLQEGKTNIFVSLFQDEVGNQVSILIAAIAQWHTHIAKFLIDRGAKVGTIFQVNTLHYYRSTNVNLTKITGRLIDVHLSHCAQH